LVENMPWAIPDVVSSIALAAFIFLKFICILHLWFDTLSLHRQQPPGLMSESRTGSCTRKTRMNTELNLSAHHRHSAPLRLAQLSD
jgi:hypothetical protein